MKKTVLTCVVALLLAACAGVGRAPEKAESGDPVSQVAAVDLAYKALDAAFPRLPYGWFREPFRVTESELEWTIIFVPDDKNVVSSATVIVNKASGQAKVMPIR